MSADTPALDKGQDIVERLRTLNKPALLPSLQRVLTDAADEIERLRAKMVRDGTGCGCRWTYDGPNDPDGTQTTECAYHEAQRRAIEDELERLRLAAPAAEVVSHTCKTCQHFQPGDRYGRPSRLGSCARWKTGYQVRDQDVADNEALVEDDEGWGMVMGPDFGCVLWEAAPISDEGKPVRAEGEPVPSSSPAPKGRGT